MKTFTLITFVKVTHSTDIYYRSIRLICRMNSIRLVAPMFIYYHVEQIRDPSTSRLSMVHQLPLTWCSSSGSFDRQVTKSEAILPALQIPQRVAMATLSLSLSQARKISVINKQTLDRYLQREIRISNIHIKHFVVYTHTHIYIYI